MVKIRQNYVSNSSSSSFVVYNWFDIPEKKRKYIMDYDDNALAVWKKNNVPFKKPSWQKDTEELVFDDGDAWEETIGNEYLSKDLQDEKYEQIIRFAFGFVFNDCRWHFEENKKRNTCRVTTSMDNFNMGKWLKYNKVDFESLDI